MPYSLVVNISQQFFGATFGVSLLLARTLKLCGTFLLRGLAPACKANEVRLTSLLEPAGRRILWSYATAEAPLKYSAPAILFPNVSSGLP